MGEPEAPAALPPLALAEELAGYLQRNLDLYSAELAIAGASGVVRNWCGWSITQEVGVTFTVDGSGTTILSLPTLHLTEVAAVTLEGVDLAVADPLTFGSFPTFDSCAWSERGQLFRAAGWPKVFRGVVAEVTHGYEVVPDAIKLVVFVLAARALANPEGLRSKTVGAISKSYVFETMRGDLSELQMTQISRYRL